MRGRGAGRRSPSGFRPSRTLGAAALIGGVAVVALAGASSEALAEVLFVSDLSAVKTYATASAGGSAYGAGDAGGGAVWSYTFTHAQAFSLSAGPSGGAGAGFDTAVADFVGSSRSVTSERSAPVTATSTEVTTRRDGDATVTTTTTATTTTTTTTMTEIAAFESLQATALNFQTVQSQFASPWSATIVFGGYLSASFAGSVVTRITSTPITRTTTITDTKVTVTSLAGTKTTDSQTLTTNVVTGPTTVTTTATPPSDPNNILNGYVSVEAIVDSSSDYTFDVVGGGSPTVTVQFMTSAGAYAPLAYELQLIDDATDAPVQSPEWISPAMAGTVTWNLSSPGAYSLIVSQYADVSAYDDLAETVAGKAEGMVRGLFNVSIAVDPGAAVPELTTCLMTIIGFVGLAWVATTRARAPSVSARPGNSLNSRVRRCDTAGFARLLRPVDARVRRPARDAASDDRAVL